MKTLYFVLSLISTAGFLQAQTWNWSSQNPVAGSDLVVTVNNLDIEEDIHVVGYYFQGKDLVSSDINYIVEDGGLKMTLKVPESSWIRIVIKDEDNKPVTGEHRDITWAGAPAKSSLIDYANATAAYYRVMGLERNESEVVNLYRDAINAYPGYLDNPVVLRSYYSMAKAAKAEADLSRIKSHVMACETAAPSVDPDMLITAIRIAKETGDTILATSLRKKLDETHPQSIVRQEEQLNLFRNANSLADKILMREQFKTTYPVSPQNMRVYDQMTSALIEECASKGEWEKMNDYINELLDPSTKAETCNEYAWILAGEGLDKEPAQLQLASDLSARSIALMTPDLKRPATMSQSEWERSLEFDKAMYGDTYALILFKQGKYDEALTLQQSAVKGYHFNDLEMNERYVVYLDKAGKKEEMMSFVEDMIKEGKASEKMKAMHEDLWMKERTQEQLYERYISQLESIAKMRRLEEVKKMWMETTATPFTLKDLEGKTVSLDDFKGKTVVLDFWATWCGPCVASFPGMKNAVQHYAGNENVVFLFVDTWENGKDVPGKVKKFITDNQYPFHVLMDSESSVVSKYKVDGIPTKFIIGPDQKIRFKSTGYGGNNEALVEELITMIEMTQNGGKIITP